MTNFGTVKQVRSMFQGGQPCPHPKGWGPIVPQIFAGRWDPIYLCPLGLTYSHQIWYDNTLYRRRSVFLSVNHDPFVRGGGGWPLASPNFGTLYMRAHSMKNNNQILHGDQNGCEVRSNTNANARSVCGN